MNITGQMSFVIILNFFIVFGLIGANRNLISTDTSTIINWFTRTTMATERLASLEDSPQFVFENNRNITVLKSNNAYIYCKVKNLGNHKVTWVKLGVNSSLPEYIMSEYSNDIMEVPSKYRHCRNHRNDGIDESYLIISAANASDTGSYYCQISTNPLMMSTYYLEVIDPFVEIEGNKTRYVEKGGLLNLTCTITDYSANNVSVNWLHDNKVLLYSSIRGGINIMVQKNGANMTSNLLIQNMNFEDEGLYTCEPLSSRSDSVLVRIITR